MNISLSNDVLYHKPFTSSFFLYKSRKLFLFYFPFSISKKQKSTVIEKQLSLLLKNIFFL